VRDLEARSFTMPDQLTGRLLAMRPDITLQAARIDAQLFRSEDLNRLCYAGSVLHAQAAGLLSSREPIQVGCELYGHSGIEADLEIQELALASLSAAGIEAAHLDLTDRGIFLALQESDPVLKDQEAIAQQALEALQSKDKPALEALTLLKPETRKALLALTELYGPARGDSNVIERARGLLPKLAPIEQALDRLQAVADSALFVKHPKCALTVDLADLKGWQYHNGIMFSVYCQGFADAVVRGGRYDGLGEDFGRSRPATGFSLELRSLGLIAQQHAGTDPIANAQARAVAAPWLSGGGKDSPKDNNDPTGQGIEGLQQKVVQLRQQGRAVVFLPWGQWETYKGPRLVREERESTGWTIQEG
jgi:ATP phosphoribosyltransferase regulatory subunit